MKNILPLFVCLLFVSVNAQNINENFERWIIKEKNVNVTGMDISSDGKTVAIVGQRDAILIYDIESKSILKEIDIKREMLGYNIFFSNSDKYLLLQEKKIETTFKRAKKGDYILIDVASGSVLQKHTKINDAKISADEKHLITLENSTVNYRDLKSGSVVNSFKLEDACNAIAVSPDGKDIAVVIKPNKQEVQAAPQVANNKKAIKAYAKYKHMIAIYDAESHQLKKIVPDIYDNINLLYYSAKGDKLMCFNYAQNSYVNIVDATNYEPTREGYLSRTSLQPEFRFSPKADWFAIATVDRYPSVNVYDVSTQSIVDDYNTEMKIWKNIKKKIYAGSNTSFVFLPDNKHLLIAFGNSLIKWRFAKK